MRIQRWPDQLAKALPDFAGQEALSPTLTGMLFPTCCSVSCRSRFCPIARKRWSAPGSRVGTTLARPRKQIALVFLEKPFLTLMPGQAKSWRPILIVNGESEETGRRILTSTVDLGSAVDADDFHRIVKRDVGILTAIHNGARFHGSVLPAR